MRSPARDGMVHARLHTPQLCWLFAVHKREEGGTPYVTCCDKQELVACVSSSAAVLLASGPLAPPRAGVGA